MAFATKKNITSLVSLCRHAMQYANSIINVIQHPTPYDDGRGPGQSYECKNYSGSKRNYISEGHRRYKYYDQGNSNFSANSGIMSQPEYNGLRNALSAIHSRLRTVCNYSGAYYPPSLDMHNYPNAAVFTPYTIAMYNSLFNSINTLNSSLNAHNSWYNSNNRCQLTCQIHCQTSCQVSCQWVKWCHDQKCGGH